MGNILKTYNLTKEINCMKIINNINLTIEKGDIYGLLGKNGAGKTTTLNLVSGLMEPSSGEIEIFGEKVSNNDYKYKSRIGIMIDGQEFYEKLTVEENLEMHRRMMGVQDKSKVKYILYLVGLEDSSKREVEKLSLGMKKRLSIARALINDPEFIILDEPTNGLDPIAISDLRNIILKLNSERKVTFLISSHILSEVERLVNKVGIIDKGMMIEEINIENIKDNNRKHIEVNVENEEKTVVIIEKEFGIKKYKVCGKNIIRIFEKVDQAEVIMIKLLESKVGVKGFSVKQEETLEDHFIKVLRGEIND